MAEPLPRYPSLDVLRGIAILGTLATNIWIFTNPEGLVGYLNGTAAAAGGWGWVEKVLQQLAQGKFLGLLTLMFGIGLAIQQRSALRAGRPWPGKYPWRAALLFVDGVVHYLLVVEFDVLMGYAVTGLVVAFVLASSERAQRRWMIWAAVIHLVLLTLGALAFAAQPPRPDPPPLDPNPYADGSWWDLVLFRIDNMVVFRIEPVFIFALSIALFLLGARLFRAGVLAPAGSGLRRRLMILGLGIALPIDLATGMLGGDAGLLVARYGTAPLVSLGLLALVAEFYCRRPRVGTVGVRLADVGRMALSSYVLQNLLASALCYGWGLGLAARLSPDARVPATVAIYLGVAAAVIAAAHLWLRRFQRGPVEWLWHRSYLLLAGDGRVGRSGAGTPTTSVVDPALEVGVGTDSAEHQADSAGRPVR
ncbi:uncharacterized protein ABIC28_003679 [Rhodococcus sp. PvR044]|uniref:DUF418 domain-containing protein n=1 Tax=unclassified Rhodococcus (in: high G+C Gram-positive bacteria) TaxID=192944 RepID=UPI000BC861BF|nr:MULTISPECIES: DUF418 domain-containing protein [unclassified Rhodococcus (in: high G+C Gram-positive bacteria)]PTR45394.1 uncharacterized protein C8K38_101121 [Rhodococcus sp. OK611]SNX88944.1 uncharacterized protein SAMN05447004_101121 [Rhodococcus sp. OK270]